MARPINCSNPPLATTTTALFGSRWFSRSRGDERYGAALVLALFNARTNSSGRRFCDVNGEYDHLGRNHPENSRGGFTWPLPAFVRDEGRAIP